jgi:beta-galactosidase
LRPAAARLLSAALLPVAALVACGGDPAPPTAGPAASPALERPRVALSGPWRFQGSDDLAGAENPDHDDAGWAQVAVPHTWGRDRHWRAAWYRLHFDLPDPAGNTTYLVFEGVSTIADVYVNGRHLGQHRGAYTRFVLDATAAVRAGDNVLAVKVSDAPRDTADTLPSGVGKTLYHSYGGLYRKAWLVTARPVHVDPTDHGAPGVFFTPTSVTAEAAEFSIRTLVRNAGAEARKVRVVHRLQDADGGEVAALEGEVEVPGGARAETTLAGRVGRPRLWGPGHPHLYRLQTQVRDGNDVLDTVTSRTGFRDFRLDASGGFVLNGKPITLRGVGKHQESEVSQAAMTDDEIRADFASLAELGVNCVRLAHYPHARLAYELADEAGLLVWAENGHSNANKTTDTGDRITREMIRQNYNHPSIVMWSVGNENAYVRVNRFAEIAQAEDPNRLVTYASNTGARGKKRYPDLDFIAHNTYRGWYRGSPWEFEPLAVQMRYIAENGGGAVISNHTDYAATHHAVDHFEPEEYRQLMAEVQLQTVFRDHAAEIPLYMVWILRDFAIDKYKGVRNTKGLLTYSNFRKDAWYLYRAFLRPEAPLVHITSKTYFLRRGRRDNGVKAYSNRPALELFLNGVSQGVRTNGDHRHRNGRRVDDVFFWAAPLAAGRNEIAVTDGAGHEDRAVVYYDGADAPAPEDPLVRGLKGDPAARPVFIDQPAQAQWPFYSELDGTADNTFDALPPEVEGAGWISTRRQSKPEVKSPLSFTAGAAADVFVIGSEASALDQALRRAGFEPTDRRGRWRDDALALVPYRLFRRAVAAGDKVAIPAVTADYVVLVRKR